MTGSRARAVSDQNRSSFLSALGKGSGVRRSGRGTLCRVVGTALLVMIGLAGPAPAEMEPTPLHRSPVTAPLSERAAPSGFVFEPLTTPDVHGIGVLDDKHGGLGVDLWNGSPRALLAKLLPALPVHTSSPALRQLMQRLLLTAAAVPAGGEDLLFHRVERLWAMGEVDGMLQLIAAVPAGAFDARLWRFRVDGLLLQGDSAAACAQPSPAHKDDDGYLAQVSAFCAALAGRTAEAALTADWLQEHGFGDDAFFAALEAMSGAAIALTSLPQPRPLHLAMARFAKLALPADAASGNEPAILRAVALDTATPTETRLIAAEKADQIGALDTEVLRHLYSTVTFSGDVADRPIDDAANPAGWRSRALLFRITQAQPSAPARAELIAKALRLGQQRGQFAATARIYAPLIEATPPSAQLAGFAGIAVRALLAAGRRDAIAAWLPHCPPAGSRADIAPVWPLLRLMEAHEDDPPQPGQLSAWLKQRTPLQPDRARAQASLLFGLLEALGDKVRTEDWLELMDGPTVSATTMPQPALWHAQRIAAEELRSGETVLLALVSLGDGFPDTIDPTAIYRVVASLRLVGFDEEARAIAVEAALAAGV